MNKNLDTTFDLILNCVTAALAVAPAAVAMVMLFGNY